jgi:phosphotransferase system enzyme I (PtsI)
LASNTSNPGAELTERSPRLKGLGVSRGIGKGNVVFLPTPTRSQFQDQLNDGDVEAEVERLRTAAETAKQQLQQLARETGNQEDHGVAEIFSVHILILESEFVDRVEDHIRGQRVNAEWAVNSVLGELTDKQTSLADENFRDKYLDIEDVAVRLRRAIRGTRAPIHLGPNAVVVARELRPSAVVELAKFKPAGLITEIGGWTSHMSIVAREFRLPMVTGIKNPEKLLCSGELVVVDGDQGEIRMDHGAGEDEDTALATYFAIESLGTASGQTLTKDEVEIIVHANADDPATYRIAESLGVLGVGLYRSELLISEDGGIPDESVQASAYAEMASATGAAGLVIRTFDISPEHFIRPPHDGHGNPALGLRAIRSGMANPELFRAQIKAILKASMAGKVDIILPMISNVEEILWAKEIIGSLAADARADGHGVVDPRVGVMIEVPSTVFLASRIARHVDFFCLGTNDLVQYLLAVDRDNDAVANWYQTLHPAVLSAIKTVIDASAAAGIPTIICGEMAGSPFYLPVLIGLGARQLSVNVNSIISVKTLLAGISTVEASELVEKLSPCETAAEVESLLIDHYQENWAHLFSARLLTPGSR